MSWTKTIEVRHTATRGVLAGALILLAPTGAAAPAIAMPGIAGMPGQIGPGRQKTA